MTLRYKSTEKCARCWQPFGAHAWGDDACPSSAGGYMRPSVFQLEKKPEPSLDEIKASLEELKKASVETIVAAAQVECKRKPLPGWGKRTPFDPFKGFKSSGQDEDTLGTLYADGPQHPLQRFSNGDGPLGKM